MSRITKLQLNHFRSYESAALAGLQTGPIVLFGANGAGKTNVLEAVSLLSPGRGLRTAKITEIQKQNSERDQRWSVSAIVETQYGSIRIGTGEAPQSGQRQNSKRLVRINGETVKSQAALSEYLACVWLTPQMDRLFLEGAAARRRFLDRLVFAFDAGHAGRTTRYENALRQRSKLLQEGQANMKADPVWLDGLESTMAETGVALAAARLDFSHRLQWACDKAEDTLFPRAHLNIVGTIEELLAKTPAVEVEELFKSRLAKTREQDAVKGGTATGPHRSDLSVTYTAKNMPADQCSTGEQKTLLIGIVLAHSRLIAAERGAAPILLLDEVAAHLDESRRAGLYDLLLDLGGQVWLTGTDESLFSSIRDKALMFRVTDGQIFSKTEIKVVPGIKKR